MTPSPTDIRTALAVCDINETLAVCCSDAMRVQVLRGTDAAIAKWLRRERPGFDVAAMVRVRRLIGDMTRQQAARVGAA